jgi:hypothetical protein
MLAYRTLRAAILLASLALGIAAGQRLEYRSPSCGPGGGSPAWACGAWPASTPPPVPRPGTAVADPDTANRVLRVTGPGTFGEEPRTAFKVFDGGWKRAWNAASDRLLVMPWNGRPVRHSAYWLGFDPARMALDGTSGPLPDDLAGVEWDPTDPDLVVGLSNGVATAYNVRSRKYTRIFDPATTGWRAPPGMLVWGGNRVCIAEAPQDDGYRIACAARDGSRRWAIDLHAQTVNGKPFPVSFRAQPASLPRTIGIHAITLAPDGKWLAIDTHGNTPCSVPNLPNYAATALFLNLETNTGYEWNIACGATHWAYGYDGLLMQSTTPKWTSAGANGPCNSDARAVARRSTDETVDSSYTITAPCSFFEPATWAVEVHLSWANNRDDSHANQYPVLLATLNTGSTPFFLANEIAAMETAAPPYRGRLWRFAQTWNDPAPSQCGFLDYSSPAISPDGRWALFPSNWRGQTGTGGVCTNGNRTDVFLFELR